MHLVLEDGLEGTMKVDDDFEGYNGILLVVVSQDSEHGCHEGTGIRLDELVLWQAVDGLDGDMAETLLGRVGLKACWYRREKLNVCR